MSKTRVGIDLNTRYLDGKNRKEVDGYIRSLREHRVINLDLIVNFVLGKENRHILKSIRNNEITVSMHSNSIEGLYTTFYSTQSIEASLNKQLKALEDSDKILREIGFNNEIPVIYHAGQVINRNRELTLRLGAEFFNRLSNKAVNLGMCILTESLSINHPDVDCLGNNWDDLYRLNKLIDSNNWGICWDTGHTRGNTIEENSFPYPPEDLIEKIKFTHIHNMYDGIDHLPLISGEWQDNEIKFLVMHNYSGIYSLEYDFRFVDENNHNELVNLSAYRLAATVDYFKRNKDNIALFETIQRSNIRVNKTTPIVVRGKGNEYKETNYQISLDSVTFEGDKRGHEQIVIGDNSKLNITYVKSRDGISIYKIDASISDVENYVKLIDFIFDTGWST